jgi:outer membrane protein OmpA-like peptidoglycan-associated protein
MLRMLLLVGLLSATLAPRPAQAQLTKLIKERVKQKVEDRKRMTEENLVTRATEPADSALERMMSPVDSVAGEVGSKAAAAVSRAGRGSDSIAKEAELLEQQLASGRAELTGVAFEPGSDALTGASEPTLSALAQVLAGMEGVFLLQGRADAGSGPDGGLAERRALALKNWLVGMGVPGERIFAAGDGIVTEAGAPASIVRVQ